MTIPVNEAEIALFITFVTADDSAKPPPSQTTKSLMSLYEGIKAHVKNSGTRITDIISVGKKYYSLLSGISEDDYMKMIKQLAMYEATYNYTQWPEFHTEREKKVRRIAELQEIVKSPAEKAHFSEEIRILGETAPDILGRAYNLAPLQELQKRVKRKTG